MSGIIEIFESSIPCLSTIIELQEAVQREALAFSAETNKYLLYHTLKQVGASAAQRIVQKLVEQGEIEWDEDWEVEQILDCVVENGVDHYFIKWKGWSHKHNTWEPKENLGNCSALLDEFHAKNSGDAEQVRLWRKRKFSEIVDDEEDPLEAKRKRVDKIFKKLTSLKNKITPIQLVRLSSATTGKKPLYKGLISGKGKKIPKFLINYKLLNPKSKAYKEKKKEILAALKDWERELNSINTDPAPIDIENNVDLEGPPENFVYLNDYKPGEGIEIPDDPLVGCECEDCYSNKKSCCPSQCGAVFAYYKHKRVRVPRGTPIYECNKRCECGPDCPNRVVQQGRKFRVCIFRTANGRGWGVKAMQNIKQGSFVMEYVGEVITNEEAERRGKSYDASGRTYLFDLDYNDGDCPFTVDAAWYGNVSHFVNHSCDPNLEVFGVWINTLDPRLPRIALFARRDIEKGEELTFDYMMTGATYAQSPEAGGDVEVPVLQPMLIDKEDTVSETSDNQHGESEVSVSDSGDMPSLIEQCENVEEVDVKLKGKVDPESESNLVSIDVGRAKDFKEKEAGPPVLTKMKKSPRAPIDEYKIMCQCGAKNCRKYLF
ncbi:hypothetical protein CHS0354_008878 [Potamilus streckersoni]|uniref:Histone-lysine N-methyltransferase n=1 Tax=Potamilus streckersoni TaxID=2493646 RepID=A0AAE0TCD4_9BIVA|nr:hypothetical protein CHS0354_008878 [Potamilus streckersoni]